MRTECFCHSCHQYQCVSDQTRTKDSALCHLSAIISKIECFWESSKIKVETALKTILPFKYIPIKSFFKGKKIVLP